MQGCVVTHLHVDSFNDVNLSIVGPIRSAQPPVDAIDGLYRTIGRGFEVVNWGRMSVHSRPSATSRGHMRKIHDKEATIIGLLGLKPHRIPSPARCNIVHIGAYIDGTVGQLSNETFRTCLLFAHIVDIAVGGIIICKKNKVIKERRACHVGLQFVAIYLGTAYITKTQAKSKQKTQTSREKGLHLSQC